jgi:integrase
MMLKNDSTYSQLTDEEWVEKITSQTADEKYYRYFFYVKCTPLLRYISRRLYNSNDYMNLMGEFYEFLSDNDWAVLKKWEKKNEATLFSYLSRCASNHFINKENAEKRRQDREILPSAPEAIEQMSIMAEEEQQEELPIMQAFELLCERDQALLRLLVIEEKRMLEIAGEVWKYINSKQNIENITAKRIQGSISMAKHRAQLALLDNLYKLSGRK